MKKQKKTGLLDNPYIDIILIIIIPVIVYFQVLSFGFTNSDDKLIISDNQSFFADISNVGKAFTKDAFITNSYELYRPLQTVTFLIDTMIGNGEVKYYHITNLLLHILVCLSIFYLLLKFGFPRIQSLLLVLIFSSAPLFSHVVAWIPARGELLLMLFGINSLNFFIHYLESKKNIYFLLNILFFLLALFSKESAIIFVLFYIFYYIFIYNNNLNMA